jgi:aminoglycoside phosphotransferase (APT) family kinase protein
MTDDAIPDAEQAAAIVEKATGEKPQSIRRFATGTGHFVFEALWPDRAPLVIRMGRSSQADALREGILLAGRLRLLGVPLPEILFEDLTGAWPWTILERLRGVDLGEVIGQLSMNQITAIATRVASAQRAAAQIGYGAGFGYAANPDAAPHARWSAVLEDNLSRSRRRIASVGLFDPGIVSRVEQLVHANRSALDAMPAVPFLHDTTTKNVIVAPDGGFSGIVDVDDLCFGDPRYAPALTLAVLRGYGGPTAYVNVWMAAADHSDDDIFQLYVTMFLIDLMAEHGHCFNGIVQPSDDEERARLMTAFVSQIERLA